MGFPLGNRRLPHLQQAWLLASPRHPVCHLALLHPRQVAWLLDSRLLPRPPRLQPLLVSDKLRQLRRRARLLRPIALLRRRPQLLHPVVSALDNRLPLHLRQQAVSASAWPALQALLHSVNRAREDCRWEHLPQHRLQPHLATVLVVEPRLPLVRLLPPLVRHRLSN